MSKRYNNFNAESNWLDQQQLHHSSHRRQYSPNNNNNNNMVNNKYQNTNKKYTTYSKNVNFNNVNNGSRMEVQQKSVELDENNNEMLVSHETSTMVSNSPVAESGMNMIMATVPNHVSNHDQSSNASECKQSNYVPSHSAEHSINDSLSASHTDESECHENHNKGDNKVMSNEAAAAETTIEDCSTLNQQAQHCAATMSSSYSAQVYSSEISCNTSGVYNEYEYTNSTVPVLGQQQQPMAQGSPYYVYHSPYATAEYAQSQTAPSGQANTFYPCAAPYQTYVYDPNLGTYISPYAQANGTPSGAPTQATILSSPQHQSTILASYQTPPPAQHQLYITPSSITSPTASLSPGDSLAANPNANSVVMGSSQEMVSNANSPQSSASNGMQSGSSNGQYYSNPQYVIYPTPTPYLTPQGYQTPNYMMYQTTPNMTQTPNSIQGMHVVPQQQQQQQHQHQHQHQQSNQNHNRYHQNNRSNRYNNRNGKRNNYQKYNNNNNTNSGSPSNCMDQNTPTSPNSYDNLCAAYPSVNFSPVSTGAAQMHCMTEAAAGVSTNVNDDLKAALCGDAPNAGFYNTQSPQSMCSPVQQQSAYCDAYCDPNYQHQQMMANCYPPNAVPSTVPPTTTMVPLGFDYNNNGMGVTTSDMVTSYGDDYDNEYDSNGQGGADEDENQQLACYVCRGRRMCFCYFLKVRYYKFPSFLDLVDHQYKKWRANVVKTRKA